MAMLSFIQENDADVLSSIPREKFMNYFSLHFTSIFIITTFLLSACSPHPGSGVWEAVADNEQGISKLTVGFEGKAEFTSSKLNNAVWHCFWSTADKKKLVLDCTPSTNPEQ